MPKYHLLEALSKIFIELVPCIFIDLYSHMKPTHVCELFEPVVNVLFHTTA